MERVSGGRGRELEVASSSRGGDLNPNRCCDRGETFGRLEGPGRIKVVGALMVVSASGRWAPRCVATGFFVRTLRVGRGICRVREMDGVRDIRTIGSRTETTRNTMSPVLACLYTSEPLEKMIQFPTYSISHKGTKQLRWPVGPRAYVDDHGIKVTAEMRVKDKE